MAYRGERTRAMLVDEAAKLASVHGLDGLSLAQLASASGMSKSGLYAHFGSKEELQLATIEAARKTYLEEVVQPAWEAPRGLARLRAACEAFLSYVERRVFPGGCFYAAATNEVRLQQGRVRDTIAEHQAEWVSLLAGLASEAQELGELASDDEAGQLAFELNALLFAGNNAFLLYGDPAALDRARRGVEARLAIAQAR